jgi:hypothetical protein
VNTTSLVQKFNFRLWGKAPFPRAIFSSAAHGSAPKNRNSYFHERHYLSLLSFYPQSVSIKQRGTKPPLSAAGIRWSLQAVAALPCAALLKPIVEKKPHCFKFRT